VCCSLVWAILMNLHTWACTIITSTPHKSPTHISGSYGNIFNPILFTPIRPPSLLSRITEEDWRRVATGGITVNKRRIQTKCGRPLSGLLCRPWEKAVPKQFITRDSLLLPSPKYWVSPSIHLIGHCRRSRRINCNYTSKKEESNKTILETIAPQKLTGITALYLAAQCRQGPVPGHCAARCAVIRTLRESRYRRTFPGENIPGKKKQRKRRSN